jgi:hypothetical protein
MLFLKPGLEKQLLKLAYQCRCAEELCVMASDVVGRPIVGVDVHNLPENVTALAFKHQDQFFILSKPTTLLSVQRSILHELAHITLGHLDDREIDLFDALGGKTYFTDPQENDVEMLACRFLNALIDVRAYSYRNTPVGARFESLIG